MIQHLLIFSAFCYFTDALSCTPCGYQPCEVNSDIKSYFTKKNIRHNLSAHDYVLCTTEFIKTNYFWEDLCSDFLFFDFFITILVIDSKKNYGWGSTYMVATLSEKWSL
jgi:hypothetical protein